MMQCFRKNTVGLLIGGVLFTLMYCFILICASYNRERDIARKIEAMGGIATLQFRGPTWLSQYVQYFTPMMKTISRVELEWKVITPELVNDIDALSNLETLNLNYAEIDDEGLKSISTLRRLKQLELDATQVSDSGLEHLSGLSNLTFLSIRFTPTTQEARKKLQERLPQCTIWADE
ncbi:MAG: F-box/LRR-repeat protein 20 [Schlesneria sp.]|nr:F-box/LRR-repeat protein 20 [Schlesneria sp.]